MTDGQRSITECAGAWERVFNDFLDGMRDSEGLRRIKLEGKINNMVFTYELIVLCLKYLQKAYDPEIIGILRKHTRVMGSFNPEDMEGYMRDLGVIRNQATGLLAQISAHRTELNLTSGKKMEVNRQHFEKLIAAVSRFVGFHLDKKTTTVSEFIEHYIAMRQQAESIQKKNYARK